jgi:hypothetical protein
MANTPDLTDCATEGGESTLTPISPYLGIHYHFGMLLGVDDFETGQAYQRGKSRLHNAWLHRDGVVWGFEVRLDTTRGEVRVLPGLALDGAGHELHLDADACLSLGAWFEEHREDAGFEVEEVEGAFRFDAHVVARYRACLTRQVPALTTPCDGGGADTAYSRVFETVELMLMPGPAPAPDAPPNHLLRLLFDLDTARERDDGTTHPVDQQVLDARAHLATLPLDQQRQARLELFRRLAASDGIAMQPAVDPDTQERLLFPSPDLAPVTLAELRNVELKKLPSGWVVSAGDVHNEVRPSHVPTRTIQELLNASLMSGAPVANAGGPRIDRASVTFGGTSVTFELDRDLDPASVTPDAFQVSTYETTTGWQVATISDAEYDATTRTATLTLSAALSGTAQRLIAFGTGATPLLGTDLVLLAGALNDPPAGTHDGRDFVFMKTA